MNVNWYTLGFEDFREKITTSGKHELNLAGTKKEDIEVTVTSNNLEVQVRGQPEYYIYLSKDVNKDLISAKYENGLLIIDIPKKQEEKRVIKIE